LAKSEAKNSGKRTHVRDGAPVSMSREPERAFLVGLDYRVRRPAKSPKSTLTAGAKAARDFAVDTSAEAKKARTPEFSAEESLAELRTLATGAGAQVVGEFLQRRDKPDPATLIGKGKLEEIKGAAASASADLILFDHDLSPSQQIAPV
jgi:GTPase